MTSLQDQDIFVKTYSKHLFDLVRNRFLKKIVVRGLRVYSMQCTWLEWVRPWVLFLAQKRKGERKRVKKKGGGGRGTKKG